MNKRVFLLTLYIYLYVFIVISSDFATDRKADVSSYYAINSGKWTLLKHSNYTCVFKSLSHFKIFAGYFKPVNLSA